MKVITNIGLGDVPIAPAQLAHIVNLKLAALGCAPVESHTEEHFQELAWTILSHHQKAEQADSLCPVDRRIQNFLDRYLGSGVFKLPVRTLLLDRYGLARALSLPCDGDEFFSDIISSYRVFQG